MKSREKDILDKIVNNNLSIGEQKSALMFLTILFVLGWVTGIVDYSNFYSDIPALIQLPIFAFIIIVPFATIFTLFKIAKRNEQINFVSAFVVLSSFSLKKLLVKFAFLIVAYVISYTILKEYFDIVYYEVQYYFSIIIILLIEIVYFRKMVKYFNLIYVGKNE